MNIKIAQTDIKLNEKQRSFLDEKVKLSLSRFNGIFETIYIDLAFVTDEYDVSRISCRLATKLYGGEFVECEVTGKDFSESVVNSLQRLKRTIERHKKRTSKPLNTFASSVK